MYTDHNPHVPHRPLHIKQDEKNFSRFLSKESSKDHSSSLRFYYGVASGAVPFIWESHPGTPKHRSSDTSFPPLTPPPSYHFNSEKKATKKTSRIYDVFHPIFPCLSHIRNIRSSLPSSSSFSCSSFSSRLSASSISVASARRCSSPRLSFDSMGEIITEDPAFGKATSSSSCFCVNNGATARRLRVCCPMVCVKKAFLSFVGNNRSSHVQSS